MAEMLVALWLSCCKPHSSGRVKPTFKPKPRYRQAGQQQWHISTYPKTKCPSFVCSPHSGNLASQHMEWSLGGSRGFGQYYAAIWQPLQCLEELKWLVVKPVPGINVEFFSFGMLLSLVTCSSFVLCFVYFSLLPFSLMFKYRSPGSGTSKRATIGYQEHLYLPSPCESLFWPVGSLLEGK